MSDTETMQAKIQKLLNKAARTDNVHEAEAFSRKAEHLMAEWGVTEAMLNDSRTDSERESITEEPMTFLGSYAKAMVLFGAHVAQGMGLKVYERRTVGDTKVRKLVIVGHASDVARAHMLITSMQMQAQTALRVWWAEFPLRTVLTPSERARARRQFLVSFAEAVGVRLGEARTEAAAQADARTTATGAGARSSALVLADRGAEVEAWLAERHPKMGHGRAMGGSSFGQRGGAAAGRDANLGGRTAVDNDRAPALAV